MKKFTVLAMVLIAGMALLTSCQKEGAKLYDVSIMVYYPEGYGIPGVGNLEVTIQNTLNGQELLVTTKENGIAKVSLEEGIYTISASHETDEFYFNGITENLTIEIERAE